MRMMLLFLLLFSIQTTLYHLNHWGCFAQFDGMFEIPGLVERERDGQRSPRAKSQNMRRKKGSLGAGNPQAAGGRNKVKTRSQLLAKTTSDIIINMDRYMMWWTGPPDESGGVSFRLSNWGKPHVRGAKSAIFTVPAARGVDEPSCSSPNDLRLFLGTARRAGFTGDIVVGVLSPVSPDIKEILKSYETVVYELPSELCSMAVKRGGEGTAASDSAANSSNISINEGEREGEGGGSGSDSYCGTSEEKVPASVFRYYIYERWAAEYSRNTTKILLADFGDVLFQSDPFAFSREEWKKDYQLLVYQEFHPNMVVGRSIHHAELFRGCYGPDALRQHGHKIVVSSGAIMGTRDAILAWSHSMTTQLQDAQGRVMESRCRSSGIDQAFTNYLVYGSKLRQQMRIKIYSHGEGAVFSFGGMSPQLETVTHSKQSVPVSDSQRPYKITGSLKGFWKLIDGNGWILNWNGERAPVVHQLNHFARELKDIAVTEKVSSAYSTRESGKVSNITRSDLQVRVAQAYPYRLDDRDVAWQALACSRCLWGC